MRRSFVSFCLLNYRHNDSAQQSPDSRGISSNVTQQIGADTNGCFPSSSETAKKASSSIGSDMRENPRQSSFTDTVPLPILLEIVDEFFIHCHNQPYCFFHEANFRQSLSEREIPQHLLYAIMASAVRFSVNPFFEDKDEAAEVYAVKSWDSLVPGSITRNGVGDLRSVQTITLLAIFDLTGLLDPSSSSFTHILLKKYISW